MCTNIFLVCMYVYRVHDRCLHTPHEDVGSSGLESKRVVRGHVLETEHGSSARATGPISLVTENFETRSLFQYFHTTVHQWRKSSKNSSRVGTWRQELMQRPRKGASSWLAPHGFLSLPCYSAQDRQPRSGTTHPQWAGPSQIND